MIKEKNFSNIIDPWIEHIDISGMPESRFATLNRYRQLSYFKKIPTIEVQSRKDILVLGTGIYKSFDINLRKRTHVVISARDFLRDFLVLGEVFKSFTFNLSIYGMIYSQLVNKNQTDSFLNVKYALSVIKPKVIVLRSTIDPINRVWAFWANELNIKVVCIQHGIFSSKVNKNLLERDIVDYYVVLGTKQSEIISSIIPIHKHINIFESSSFIFQFENKKKINICFIGSDYERYSEAGKIMKEKLLDIYTDLIQALSIDKSVEYKLFYKMHPSETKMNKVLRLAKTLKKTEYDKIDVFFGVTSTLLMDLSSRHKCVIQLRSKFLDVDNYQDLGYCASVDIDNIKARGLLSTLEKIKKYPCLKEKSLSKVIESISNLKSN